MKRLDDDVPFETCGWSEPEWSDCGRADDRYNVQRVSAWDSVFAWIEKATGIKRREVVPSEYSVEKVTVEPMKLPDGLTDFENFMFKTEKDK